MRQREEGRAHLVAFTLDLEPLGFLYESREPVLIQQPASASRRLIDRFRNRIRHGREIRRRTSDSPIVIHLGHDPPFLFPCTGIVRIAIHPDSQISTDQGSRTVAHRVRIHGAPIQTTFFRPVLDGHVTSIETMVRPVIIVVVIVKEGQEVVRWCFDRLTNEVRRTSRRSSLCVLISTEIQPRSFGR